MITIYNLINGEQIIGDDLGANSIGDPFYIIDTQDEYGNNGMKLINVCTFSSQQYIVVNDTHVIFSIPADDSMIRYYKKLLGAVDKASTLRMIEQSINELDELEESMTDVFVKRLVGGSTIN